MARKLRGDELATAKIVPGNSGFSADPQAFLKALAEKETEPLKLPLAPESWISLSGQRRNKDR